MIALFMLIPLAGLAYTLWHIWCVLPFTPVIKGSILALLTICFLLLFVGVMPLFERIPLSLGTWIYEIGTSSVIVLLYLVLIFALLDVGRLVGLVPKSWLYHNGTTSLLLLVFMSVLLIYGHVNYSKKHREIIELTTKKQLPNHEMRIVMVSDLHLGYHHRRATLAKWIDLINGENPDMVLIAGDVIDGGMQALFEENMAEEWKRVKAPVFAVLGNHEYMAGLEQSMRFYRDAGICLLRDSVANIGSLAIIGRDDRTNPHRKNLRKLMQGVDKSRYLILLDHQPHHLEQAEMNGIDFQFSGHTHRGQVWPISLITDNVYEVSYGSYRKGHTQYYVSSGLGLWGGKYRIGTRSEYVVVTLKEA